MKLTTLLPCLLLAALAPLHAADFDLNGHGTATVKVPEGWTSKGEAATRPNLGEIGYTITLTAPDDINAKALITCLYVKRDVPTKEGVEEFLRQNAAKFAKGSVEGKITPHDFAVKQGFGAYSIFTDPKLVGQPPKKGDCKVMASGIIQPDEQLVVVVTLLTDDAEGKDFKAMVEAVNSLLFKKPGGPTI